MSGRIIYQYSLGKKAEKNIFGNLWGFFISKMYIVMILGSILFVIASFYKGLIMLPFALLMVLLALFFGPYLKLLKSYYQVIYYEDETLELKSIINFIPRKCRLNLKEITLIRRENPLKAQALQFKNASGKVLGRFNHILLGPEEFNNFMNLLTNRNRHIEVKFK